MTSNRSIPRHLDHDAKPFVSTRWLAIAMIACWLGASVLASIVILG